MTQRAEALWQILANQLPHQTWWCPLCSHSSTTNTFDLLQRIIHHATTEHPAYLPDGATVLDMLTTLPALLKEVALTIDAPNPDGPEVQIARGAKRDELVTDVDSQAHRWSKTPKRIKTMRALDPDLDTSLFASLVLCSRLVWEALDMDARRAHTQPIGTPCWATELRWLRLTWTDAQAYLDPADFDWIADEMRSVWVTVATLAGVRPRPRNLCPDCRAPMHLGDDDWLTCEAGHQHPGPRRLERQWRRKPPMATAEICEALRVPQGTVWRWHHEGRIKPSRQEGRAMYWLPWDVIALRYPDIVADIDKRDAA